MSKVEYKLHNPHPGEMLLEEFMKPLGLTAYRVAKDIGVPTTRVDDITAGRRSITADSAIRLSSYFGNSAEFWLNLQSHYELMEARRKMRDIKIPVCRLISVEQLAADGV